MELDIFGGVIIVFFIPLGFSILALSIQNQDATLAPENLLCPLCHFFWDLVP